MVFDDNKIGNFILCKESTLMKADLLNNICPCFLPVLHEIQERIDWLEEMKKLGEGRMYESIIKTEIEERLRRIKRLQPDSTEKKKTEEI